MNGSRTLERPRKLTGCPCGHFPGELCITELPLPVLDRTPCDRSCARLGLEELTRLGRQLRACPCLERNPR